MAQTNLSVDPNSFVSLTDLGYKQAGNSDTLRSMARYALDKIVGFPEEINETDKASLFAGYMLKYNDNNPKLEYVNIDGHYVGYDTLNDKQKKLAENNERIFIGVEYAMSYSRQQFGSLKDTEPAKHTIIKKWRDDYSDYSNNRFKDLVRKAKELLNGGKKRERGATKWFDVRVSEILDDLKSKCKTAQSRGDSTADIKALNDAITAFNAVWLK